VRNPELSAGILDRKLGCVDRTEASILITDNPGCILHLRGGVHASGREVEVLHLAEYLAGRLPGGRPRRATRPDATDDRARRGRPVGPTCTAPRP
jgi:hypothetical protein